MKILITLLLIAFAVDAAIMYKLVDRMDEFRQIQKRQGDAIGRVAVNQFEDRKRLNDVADELHKWSAQLEKLSQSVGMNAKEIDKVRRFSERLSTHPEEWQ